VNVELPTKKTKIICTIGPSSWDQPVLEQMILAGMNIARLNLAHGNFSEHQRTITNVRAASQAVGQRVALFADLPGPKMRIGQLSVPEIELVPGKRFVLQTENILGDTERVSLDFTGLPKAVKPGDRIFMNDGYIQLQVDEISNSEVYCTVKVGGVLRSYQGVNFPGIDLGISAFTEQDQELLAFAAEQKLDGVGESFVQGVEDILALRRAAEALNYHPFIIAKIERAGALDNIDEILEVTDGIMVARGDLGVEIPIEKIPTAQKDLIRRANLVGKPVITATQMLESMTDNRRPTRSEATDVANAILDGTDCVMLSAETAIGRYPVETVTMMANLAREAETRGDQPARFGFFSCFPDRRNAAAIPGNHFGQQWRYCPAGVPLWSQPMDCCTKPPRSDLPTPAVLTWHLSDPGSGRNDISDSGGAAPICNRFA
jgi:pyruvate kinase